MEGKIKFKKNNKDSFNGSKSLGQYIGKPNTNRFSIGFGDIIDLSIKIKRLKIAHKADSNRFRKLLEENEIIYEEINPFGVSIDISFLSDKQIQVIANYDKSFIENIYKELGIVEN